MKVKITFILVFSFLFFGFRFAQAGLIINEIMYDLEGTDTGREWIEIYNPDETIEITEDWRFNDGSSHWMNNQEPFSISGNSYFILASNKDTFLSDHLGFSGTVIDTTMNLNNTEGTVKILNASGNEVDSVNYNSSQGAGGNGNSLQKISNTWTEASPTPGLANEESSSPPPDEDDGDDGNSSGGNSSNGGEEEIKKEIIKNPTIKAKILANSLAFVRQPHEMQVSMLGYSNESLVLGKVYWNFGDGSSLEQINNFEKFSHNYYYPGEYPVLLEYFAGPFSKEPEATSKMIIKVIPTTVLISRIGKADDFFVELTNSANYDIDISGWNLKAGVKNFFFPKNSLILSKKQMTLSDKITGFTFGDQYNLKLFSATGELISDYYNRYLPVEKTVKKQILSANISSENEITEIPSGEAKGLENKIPNSDLLSSAFASESKGENRNFYLFSGIFLVLLLVSGTTVYFIRQKKAKVLDGSDFEILDE
jgi:hypothetical protein